jgi:transposase, IS30 family
MHTHITKETRIKFSALLLAGLSLRESAKLLGVHHTTLSRELRRNPAVYTRKRYDPGDAHRKTKARRYSANQRWRKILPNSKLEQLLVMKITVAKWAPEQIAGWLKATKRAISVCAQTIYDWVYTSRTDLVDYLHCRKGKYRRTRQARLRKDKRAELASPRNIAARPKRIEQRKTYGHWEGDTVHGAGKTGYIATFVERKSGYLLAQVLTTDHYSSSGFAIVAAVCLNQIKPKHRKTLTLDNGPEMKGAETIERKTGATVYYANPYHSWERGTNENTNGLLRYFFPKKSSFRDITQEELDLAVKLINTRPRKRLGWRSPQQMLKV